MATERTPVAPRVSHVGVVVPAHDEQASLGRCLDSVAEAIRALGDQRLSTTVVVVADACTDRTALIARSRGVEVLTVSGRNVGAARAAGTDRLLGRWPGVALHRLWIAHTDADGSVPMSWLRVQLAAAQRHDAFVGTVDLQPCDGDTGTRTSWRSAYLAGGHEREHGGHGHVHGANLGFLASAYTEAGGFEPLPVDEDRTLVRALLSRRARIAWVADAPVTTSGRVVGRASGGFATYLQALQDPA